VRLEGRDNTYNWGPEHIDIDIDNPKLHDPDSLAPIQTLKTYTAIRQ